MTVDSKAARKTALLMTVPFRNHHTCLCMLIFSCDSFSLLPASQPGSSSMLCPALQQFPTPTRDSCCLPWLPVFPGAHSPLCHAGAQTCRRKPRHLPGQNQSSPFGGTIHGPSLFYAHSRIICWEKQINKRPLQGNTASCKHCAGISSLCSPKKETPGSVLPQGREETREN